MSRLRILLLALVGLAAAWNAHASGTPSNQTGPIGALRVLPGGVELIAPSETQVFPDLLSCENDFGSYGNFNELMASSVVLPADDPSFDQLMAMMLLAQATDADVKVWVSVQECAEVEVYPQYFVSKPRMTGVEILE